MLRQVVHARRAQNHQQGEKRPDELAVDAAAARDQDAALLPVIERVLGSEHPQTLAVREELGYWTNEADGAVSGA